MIQEIAPHVLDNHMRFEPARPDDALIVLREGEGRWIMEAMLAEQEGQATLPTCGLLADGVPVVYAFEVDGRRHFLALPGHGIEKPFEGFRFAQVSYLRRLSPKATSFAVLTAIHLFKWYSDNRFCGRCTSPLELSDKERALYCPACGATVHPVLMPVVIVAVVHKDKLLMTRYAGPRGTHRALVAGFVEVGETPEQAAAREVMEECGLRVRNIRYAGSQPWGIAEELLLGYTAELDGDEGITLDRAELADAEWVAPGDVYEECDDFSLTNDLMTRFKEGRL